MLVLGSQLTGASQGGLAQLPVKIGGGVGQIVVLLPVGVTVCVIT